MTDIQNNIHSVPEKRICSGYKRREKNKNEEVGEKGDKLRDARRRQAGRVRPHASSGAICDGSRRITAAVSPLAARAKRDTGATPWPHDPDPQEACGSAGALKGVGTPGKVSSGDPLTPMTRIQRKGWSCLWGNQRARGAQDSGQPLLDHPKQLSSSPNPGPAQREQGGGGQRGSGLRMPGVAPTSARHCF